MVTRPAEGCHTMLDKNEESIYVWKRTQGHIEPVSHLLHNLPHKMKRQHYSKKGCRIPQWEGPLGSTPLIPKGKGWLYDKMQRCFNGFKWTLHPDFQISILLSVREVSWMTHLIRVGSVIPSKRSYLKTFVSIFLKSKLFFSFKRRIEDWYSKTKMFLMMLST